MLQVGERGLGLEEEFLSGRLQIFGFRVLGPSIITRFSALYRSPMVELLTPKRGKYYTVDKKQCMRVSEIRDPNAEPKTAESFLHRGPQL